MHLEFTNCRIIESSDDLEGDEEAQLAEAARRADGEELPAALRLDPEHPSSVLVSAVELWDVVDETEEPVYQAWFFMMDHGYLFEADSTEVIAEVVQSSLELSDDMDLWKALAEAHARASKANPDSELARMDFTVDETRG